jgi:DNA/RNA-binding domain of Phe-tRNA-synthetase-like protein
MNLSIASDVMARAPTLRLGLLTMRGLTIRAKDDALWNAIERACAAFAARCTTNTIATDARATAVRRLFKAIGADPTRYRPSSEALARRVTQGKGLYQINTAVDVNNWCSLESRLPFGIYDAQHVGHDVVLRIGRADEAYEGIGRSHMSLANKLVLSDEHGAFGSPISDSARALVTIETRDIHLVIFAPDVSADDARALAQTTAERMTQYTQGVVAQIAVN